MTAAFERLVRAVQRVIEDQSATAHATPERRANVEECAAALAALQFGSPGPPTQGGWQIGKTSCHCNREDDGHGWAVLYENHMVGCLRCLSDRALNTTGHEARIAHLEKENKKLRDECTKLHVLNWTGPPPAYREARAALDGLREYGRQSQGSCADADAADANYEAVLRVLDNIQKTASCSPASDWGCEARRKLGIARGHLESIRELLDDEREPNDSIRAVIDLAMSETAQPELCSNPASLDPLTMRRHEHDVLMKWCRTCKKPMDQCPRTCRTCDGTNSTYMGAAWSRESGPCIACDGGQVLQKNYR